MLRMAWIHPARKDCGRVSRQLTGGMPMITLSGILDEVREAQRLSIAVQDGTEQYRKALEEIARLKVLEDDNVNRVTLHCAIEIARGILE
jgi:hypothetical protein